VARALENFPQPVEAERVPQFRQRPHIAIVAGWLECEMGSGQCFRHGLAGHAQQAGNDRFQIGVQSIKPPERGNRALFRAPVVIASATLRCPALNETNSHLQPLIM